MSNSKDPRVHKGRGAAVNPQNRFEKTGVELDLTELPEDDILPSPRTQIIKDSSRSIINKNDSPDLSFTYSLNAYRGCEHGCAYCYARPTHEYLGFSSGLDFETKIMVKENAAELLRESLAKPSWQPDTIFMSGVTDCYQPLERKLKLTRACLEVLAEARNPVAIVTKNHLVTRDIDLLSELAKYRAVAVALSITSLDPELAGKMEPRASRPAMRLDAIRRLSEAGIPVGVNVAPVLPAITDHEIPSILEAAAEAGAKFAGTTVVRLPYSVKDVFLEWLERHFPDRREKVIHRIESLRGGKLNDPNFGSRMKGEGAFAEQIHSLFKINAKRLGLLGHDRNLSTEHFRRPGRGGQMAFL